MSDDTILGVNPGTRFVSIAIVCNGALVHYRIKAFFGAWSQEKLQAIVVMLGDTIKRYHVTAIAVKIPDLLPISMGFTQLIGSINVLCERNGITPRYHRLSDIKTQLCSDAQSSTELVQCIVQKHPELLPEYRKEHTKGKKKDPYYHKVFEAVAVTHMPYDH